MVFSKLMTGVTWPACGSWFSKSVSRKVLVPSVLRGWSIISWLPPSKLFVFSSAKRVLPRWSSPWLLGVVNVRPLDGYWELRMSSAFLPLLCFLLPHFMCIPKLIKVIIQFPSPQSTSFRFLLLDSSCDLRKDPFTWSSQPLFYLSREMQFVKSKVPFRMFTARRSCLALNPSSPLLPENFKSSVSVLGNLGDHFKLTYS